MQARGRLALKRFQEGALEVTLCDQHPKVVKQLEKTAELFNHKKIIILKSTIPKDLKFFKNPFDIIFLDPPFDNNLITPSLQALLDNKIINNNTIIYIELRKSNKIILNQFNFKMIKQKITGDVCYGLYQFIIQ